MILGGGKNMLTGSWWFFFFFPILQQNQDFLLHMPMGNRNMGQEAATEDRLTTAVPTLPMLPAPDLTTPMPADTVCSCEACNERRSVQRPRQRRGFR